MKKHLMIFAAVLLGTFMTFVFTSCEGKDKVDNPLVGTWKRTTEFANYTYVFDETNFTFTDSNGTDTKIDKGTYELNQEECNGVLHYKTVTFNSEVQHETFPNEEDVRFKYEIKENTLTITIGLDWERPRVEVLTKE